METFPKMINDSSGNRVQVETSYKHCNICRNFKNACDPKHRYSKAHQMKLSGRFEIIKSKMKMIRLDSITAHDEEWETEADLYCYFCDKPVKIHQTFNGFMIEYLGYMTHLAEVSHKESVKSYLVYHGRKEKINIFCKTQDDLKGFMDKVPVAVQKYVAKLNFLDKKSVDQIRETEAERQQLLQETFQVAIISAGNAALTMNNEQCSQLHYLQPSTSRYQTSKKSSLKSVDIPKVPPWQLVKNSNESDVKQIPDSPVIGPTIETLARHVANQSKKGLPAKRVGANFKRGPYSANWLPAFGGVWNKGRRRQMKSSFKQRYKK